MKKIIITLFVAGIFVAFLLSALNFSRAGKVISLIIEPSSRKDNWTTYSSGAKVILEGEKIKSAEVRIVPTGSGMGMLYPEGKVLGDMARIVSASEGESWILELPDYLMTTNFFVVATDFAGNKIKSIDLGQVAFNEI